MIVRPSSSSGTTIDVSSGPDKFNSESRSSVKILLVEDHEIVRKGLCDLIDGHSSWRVCGEAGNGKEAIEKTLTLNPDLVVEHSPVNTERFT